MNGLNLLESIADFKDNKDINREQLKMVLDEVFRAMLRKQYGTDENFDIILNMDRGDIQIFRFREIVEDDELEDDQLQIAYSEAVKVEPDFEVGEEVTEEIKLEDLGRRAVLSLRQNLIAKISDVQKDEIYQQFKDKLGELIHGEVYQVWHRELLLLLDDTELILPRDEMIPGEHFRKGENVRAVVAKVEIKNGNLRIVLSRTAPEFLEKLFEEEVPEIKDGLITVKKIVRAPGERAKVAVESFDDRVDPVGACVGMKGNRISSIVKELRNENIDVINYTNNTQLFISRALSPAKISSMEIDEENQRAKIMLNADQISLAIGKGGNNIKLASKLTGYELDVYREDGEEMEDVDLDEFADEIEGWVIDEFKAIGCDTARSVLQHTVDFLVKNTDLEEETIEEVMKVLKSEFED